MKKNSLSAQKLGWILIGLVAATIYYLSLNAYYVGFFNDDAFYVLGSRSLLSGSYLELNRPGTPPLVSYVPLYPLLLAPLSWLSPESTLPHQFLSFVLIAVSMVLFYKLFFNEIKGPLLTCTILVTLFNPLFVSLSGTVLADIPFLTYLLGVLFLYKKIETSPSSKRWILFFVLLGLSYYLRPSGLTLPLSMALILLIKREWKKLFLLSGITVALVTPWFIRTSLVRDHSSVYFGAFMTGSDGQFSLFGRLPHIFTNFSYYTHELFVRDLFRWPFSSSSNFISEMTVFLCLFITVWGAIKIKKSPVHQLLIVFVLLYFSIHLPWKEQMGRYLFPILPFVVLLFFYGLTSLPFSSSTLKRSLYATTALLLLLFIPTLGHIIHTSLFLKTPVNTPPQETYTWVKNNSSPSDIFVVELDGRFFLHTGRKAYRSHPIVDPEEFKLWTQQNNVSYIMIEPTVPSFKSKSLNHPDELFNLNLLKHVLTHMKYYLPVFQSEKENTFIFKVK